MLTIERIDLGYANDPVRVLTSLTASSTTLLSILHFNIVGYPARF